MFKIVEFFGCFGINYVSLNYKIRVVNDVMLCKFGWKIVIGDDVLWVRVVWVKYFCNKNFFYEVLKVGIFYICKDICRGFESVVKGVIWIFNNGCIINFWFDLWVDELFFISSIICMVNDDELYCLI